MKSICAVKFSLRLCYCLALVALVFLPGRLSSRSSAAPGSGAASPEARSTGGPAAPVGQYNGAGSCSSPSCHGAVRPRTETPIGQNEYSIWVVKDKHSHAFAVLSNPVATRMARILGLPRADTAPKCLACHALSVAPEKRAQTFELGDGVSCENCHGPASGWLGPHTTKGWTREESLKLGMYDTRNLVKRTDKCLECHLGGQEKFVDHEMIAAGHPDLYFELDSFSAAMPRHWKEPYEREPWRDVQEWGVGQAAQLRGALHRLMGRAGGKVWPEYAELDCFACHHALVSAEQSWRQERGYPGRRPGDPPWNASRYAVFRDLLREADPHAAETLEGNLTQLAREMSRLNPDRSSVAAEAGGSAEIAEGLIARLQGLSYDQALTLRLLRRISGDGEQISGQGERAAEQAVMALDSLFVAYTRNGNLPNQPGVRAAIDELFRMVENPSAYNQLTFAAGMRRINALLQ